VITLRKSRFVVFLVVLITLSIPLNIKASSYNYAKIESKEHYNTPENSKEKLCLDILMTLLVPNLQYEVDNYYKEYLSVTPTVAPYDVPILSMDRISESGTFDFRLKLELHPYVGPHLDVGLDYITVRVNPVDKVKIEKFEHIKSYDLPSYYQNIIKKKLP
jgi:hypothetical protein